jgi:hypothetical protein
MKDIKDMNLAEAITALRDVDVITRGYQCNYDAIEELADRIHDLTRWIPVSESEPNRGDIVLVKGTVTGDVCKPFEGQMGLVEWGSKDYSLCVDGCYYSVWYSDITHWQRITPPETP